MVGIMLRLEDAKMRIRLPRRFLLGECIKSLQMGKACRIGKIKIRQIAFL